MEWFMLSIGFVLGMIVEYNRNMNSINKERKRVIAKTRIGQEVVSRDSINKDIDRMLRNGK